MGKLHSGGNFALQDAALVAMRSEVVAETTKLRNQALEDARQGLQQQVQQEVSPHSASIKTMELISVQSLPCMLHTTVTCLFLLAPCGSLLVFIHIDQLCMSHQDASGQQALC